MKLFKMKKLFMGGLVGLILFIGIFVVKAATTDTTPPTLKSISIKNPKNTYSAGERIYLNLEATDDVSGISGISVGITAIEKDNPEDSLAGTTAEIYDFNGNPYIELASNLPNGKYNIDQIYLTDNAGNFGGYTNFKEFDGINALRYMNYNANFTIKTRANDTTPPVLKSISLNKNSYVYGEKIYISADAYDNDSGIKEISVNFYLEKNYDKIWTCELKYNEATKKYEGAMDTPAYNGTYTIGSVELCDNNGNLNSYGLGVIFKDENSSPEYSYGDSLGLKDKTFKVTKAPVLSDPTVEITKMEFSYKKITPPSVFKLRFKLNDSLDMIDRADVSISLPNNNSKPLQMFLKKDEEGYLSGYVEIPQYAALGVYYLNYINLYSSIDWISEEFIEKTNQNLKFEKVALFEAVSDNTYDVVSSTTDKELISKIKEAKDGAKIAINTTDSSKIKKEVFQAIKGTNKKIYLETGGIQWIFDGKDITKPKDIDVNVVINFIYNDNLNSKIGDYINHGLIINFANNGKLPGIAQIRVKMDYALRDYLGTENLNIYHYKQKFDKNSFDPVAYGLKMTEDGYLEFYIDHNSTFIISDKKIDDEYVSENIDDLALNDKNVKQTKEKQKTIKKSKNVLLFASIGAGIILVIIVTSLIIINKKHKKQN